MRRHQLQWKKVGPREGPAPGLDALTAEEVPVLDPPLQPRDEAVFLLQIAAEVEHALMAQYLYAAYSLKGPTEVPPEHAERIGRWKQTLLAIAREEMGHYVTVQNLLRLIGGPLHYDRGEDPLHETLHPFPFCLESFTRESLARYIIAEMPRTATAGMEELLRRARTGKAGPPGPLHRVGRLYERLIVLFAELTPDACAFRADAFQGTEAEWRGGAAVLVPPVATLEQALEALRRISLQGEGLHVQRDLPSHFDRFMEIDADWPADLVASRPVPSAPAISREGDPAPPENHISHPLSRRWAELFNLRYRLLLGLLSHALMLERSDQARRSFLVSTAFSEMVRVLGPIAQRLTTLPRHPSRPASEAAAGPVFGLPYTTDLSDRDADRWRVHVDVLDTSAALLRALLEASGEGDDAAFLRDLQAADQAARQTMTEWIKDAPSKAEAAPIIVAGSGPAGLAAAMALARGGLKVRLVEYAPRVGGKVNSHHQDGRSYEHGVHGWWMNYLNFDRLLDWAGVDRSQALKEAEGSNLVLTTGESFQLRTFRVNVPSPLFMAIHTLRAPYLSLLDMLRAVRFFVHLLAFDHRRDYARYDAFSFQQLLDHCGVSRDLRELVLEPFILSFDFTTANRVSAGCGLSGMQFYVLPDQRSLLTRWARGLPDDVIFSPIVRKLRELGVEVSLSTALEKVEISDGQVTGVRLGQTGATGAPRPASVTRVPLAQLPNGDFQRVQTSSGNVWMSKANNAVVALGSRCTHMGCEVDWRADAGRFVCPCHGSQFAPSGQVVRGPATAPLSAVPCRVVNDAVEVTGEAESESVPCRDVVIATDLEAAKRILAASPGVPQPLRDGMARLDTNPVIVIRMWFDPAIAVRRPLESALTPRFTFIDNLFDLNQFNDAIRAEGHVIEVQSYRVTSYLDKTDEELLAVTLEDLALVYPELRGARPTHYTVNRHLALFTRYAPGQDENRPGDVSGVNGLHLSGDWTRMDWSVWMMERGVSTGLRAANAVLRQRGLPEVPILRLPEEHWFLRLVRTVCRALRATVFRSLPAPAPLEPVVQPTVPAPAAPPAPDEEPRATGTDGRRR